MENTAIILISEVGLPLAETIKRDYPEAKIFSKNKFDGVEEIDSISEFLKENHSKYDAYIFIGAMGICIRSIAPYVTHKYSDPAIINIDSTGKFVISVMSGHVGGANALTKDLALLLGATPVITTQSDNLNVWSLDILGERFGWKTQTNCSNFNEPLTLFVNGKKTALLLECRDKGTAYLEQNLPNYTTVFYKFEDINLADFELLLLVSPFLYPDVAIPCIQYIPKVLHLGVGCRRQCKKEGIADYVENELRKQNISADAIADLSTITLKKDEPLMAEIQTHFGDIPMNIYTSEDLQKIDVPNPSEKVKQVTQSVSVSEASAIASAEGGPLIIEKQKGKLSEGNDFTFAVAFSQRYIRQGHVEIVGAGPGDPELVSVKGKHFLEMADLILYAGSLVPKELTYYAKDGATVRSSADMDLEEQFQTMKTFYDKGLLVVRLHTGDPCIYGAIQEQMAYFDEYNMSYHITPGISSFQAAAAELKSQFTIPEKVQTIILTRGSGRTPMPEKEQLAKLAKSQSTMCIYLSAGIAEKVQQELLEHYPPTTPVAVCYKLTWKEQKIFRGTLENLAKLVNDNNLKLTTLMVVGVAIDNRKGLSRLYAHEFKHIFRK
ncbi:precorrin-4 C11-methyltransferase [Balneicella halophila]|uniref:Precorrin-4 C11-methyltransferase n=1 Tax=Balneicella halophila TaxID=1537566 RepID=A0A7L4UQV6_BALHA|nr:precorrin-4 C(11)-methyltransferase [Balneicella halophila]PVX52158.1 precorrin-4 C11-methyltransferase [Balneicella halophila]